MDPLRACTDSRPEPPNWSRTASEAFTPGRCRPWPGALGVPGDAFWSVLDRFKPIELLRAPSPPARILGFAFFRARFAQSPPGCSLVQCCLGGPGGRESGPVHLNARSKLAWSEVVLGQVGPKDLLTACGIVYRGFGLLLSCLLFSYLIWSCILLTCLLSTCLILSCVL